MTAQINQEKAEIEQYLSAKASVYDFDADYTEARSRLFKLRNPAGNYNVARRAAVARYLDAKKGGTTKAYLGWARHMALSDLAEVKVDFQGLNVKVAA